MVISNIKVGFVGFGEVNSPKEIIEKKCAAALEEIRSLGVQVISTHTVSDHPDGLELAAAIMELQANELDALIICLAGWIPSHAVISVTERFKNTPMILWGLAGDKQNGAIVTAAAQAGTTALRKVFHDLGYRFKYIYNIIGQPSPLIKIREFLIAANAVKVLNHAKVGMMGYRDMKLYNTLYEGISLKRKIGPEVEFFEMLEMVQYTERIPEDDVISILHTLTNKWDFKKPVDEPFLKNGIRYYLAIKQLAQENNWSAVSLKDVDGMKKLLHFPPAMIFMLLADETNLCTIPENDTMGAVSQLIVKQLTGQCAAYLEYYEFFESSLLMGVPDYVPAEVVEGKVTVTTAAFGGISGGLLNISTLKTGRVTLVRFSNTGDEYAMHLTTGQAQLRRWEEAGWDQPAPQLPSLEIFIDIPVEQFTQEISGQHYILVYGDHSAILREFCYLKNIKVI